MRGRHVTVVAVFLVWFAPSSGCSHSQAPHNVLRRGINGEPSTLDPAAAADSFSTDVIRDLYEGLTSESSTGDPLPGVASSWSVSPDGTVYTFKLRADARWSNGKPLTARDFVVAWQRVLDPNHGSPTADLLNVVKGARLITQGKAPTTSLGVVAVRPDTLVVELEQPVPYFPALVANPVSYPIYSSESAKSHDPQRWVSNGPYLLKAWHPGSDLTLERNPVYWDRSHVHFERVDYQIAPDDEVQVKQYRADELDMTDSIPPNDLAMLQRAYSQELRISPFLGTVYLGFNMTSGPLVNRELRQALAMAIDRKRLVAVLGFGQVEAYGFVPSGTHNYEPQQWPWARLSDEQRIAEAKRLYATAGFSASTPLRLRILFNSNPAIKSTAIVVASMWKDVLGIDSDFTDEEYKVFLETRHDRSRWDVARFSWLADYNDAVDFLDILRSKSANNDEGYLNAAYDELLDRALAEPNSEARGKLLRSSEQMLLNDYPISPLYFLTSKRLIKPRIAGASLNPLNHLPSKILLDTQAIHWH